MSEYTPKPWRYRGYEVMAGKPHPDGTHIVAMVTTEADGHLIAAAPDMLEALEEVLLHTRHATLSDDALDALDTAGEAVAKAKGRAE